MTAAPNEAGPAREYDAAVSMMRDTGETVWLINGGYLLAVTVLVGAVLALVPQEVAARWPFVAAGAAGLVLCFLWWSSFERVYAFYNLRIEYAKSLEKALGYGLLTKGHELGQTRRVWVGDREMKLHPPGAWLSMQAWSRWLIGVFAVLFMTMMAVPLVPQTVEPAAPPAGSVQAAGGGLAATLAVWAEPVLAALGILTLVGAVLVWRERWRIANLRVGRRAYRARRILELWLKPDHPSFDPIPDPLPEVASAVIERVDIWHRVVAHGEDEVQAILEEMVDIAGEAGPRVRRATREAYLRFMRGSDLTHLPSGDLRQTQAHLVAARGHFEAAFKALRRAGPRALLSPTAASPDD